MMTATEQFLIDKYKDPTKYSTHHIMRDGPKRWVYRFTYRNKIYKDSVYDNSRGYINSLKQIIEKRDKRMIELCGETWLKNPPRDRKE